MLFNFFNNTTEKSQRFFLVLFFTILSVGCSKEDSSDALLITAASEEVDVFPENLSVEEVDFDFNIAYCIEGNVPSTVWMIDDLGVVIEGETSKDRDPKIMYEIVLALDDVIDQFYLISGLPELEKATSFKNRLVIEVPQDNCGAGGLAHHGIAGISVGIYFLDQIYDSFAQGNKSIHQIFYYELNRNFWIPSWNDKIEWSRDQGDWDWGHWTVGFNNAHAILMPKQLGYGFMYFGQTSAQFENSMVMNLNIYTSNDQYNFENGWMQSWMVWDDKNTINDLMTGLIVYSYDRFGGEEWLKNVYYYLNSDVIANRESMKSYQQCRDNIYKIWSLSAERDLEEFFQSELKWVISNEAIEFVNQKIN